MKTIKLTVELECKDSTLVADIVSDLEDGLLCDNVKKTTIKCEMCGGDAKYTFENPDFEE